MRAASLHSEPRIVANCWRQLDASVYIKGRVIEPS